MNDIKPARLSANTKVAKHTHLIQVAELRFALGVQDLHLKKDIILILGGTSFQAVFTPGLYKMGYSEEIP